MVLADDYGTFGAASMRWAGNCTMFLYKKSTVTVAALAAKKARRDATLRVMT
ncbi:hypothetical protein IJJ12_03295 [bacterium]|nr:hypothetical protein [bacterium]